MFKFVRDQAMSTPDNQRLKAAVAQLAYFSGMEHLNAGRNDDAARLLQQALTAAGSIDFVQLRAEGGVFSKEKVAEIHFQLGVATVRSRGEAGYALAAPNFEKAVAIWTDRQTIDLRNHIRAVLQLISSINRELGKSIKLSSRANLAESYAYLGSSLKRSGEIDASRESYKKSIAQYTRLADAHPDKIQYRINVANSLGNLGLLEVVNNRPKEALKWFEKGIQLFKKLEKSGKHNDTTRRLLKDFQSKSRQLRQQ